MKSKLMPLMAVLILAAALYSVIRTQPRLEANPPPVAPPSSEFEERIAAAGIVEPRSESISVASHLPGVVDEILVEVGQEVRRGDPLVRLDTRALEAARGQRREAVMAQRAAVETAAAQVRRAEAGRSEVRRTLKFAESVSDSRSISAEELTRRRSAVEIAEAEVQAAEASLVAARAAVGEAEAALRAVETDLERSTVTAPIDGQVLQVRIRRGEFAPAGPSAEPWMVLGDVTTLRVRADIDEHEAWRVPAKARATAQVRGNANLRVPLRFLRFEPLVVPKRALTGSSTERVDTRVLQVIYEVERGGVPLYVGQQVDVFIEGAPLKAARVDAASNPVRNLSFSNP